MAINISILVYCWGRHLRVNLPFRPSHGTNCSSIWTNDSWVNIYDGVKPTKVILSELWYNSVCSRSWCLCLLILNIARSIISSKLIKWSFHGLFERSFSRKWIGAYTAKLSDNTVSVSWNRILSIRVYINFRIIRTWSRGLGLYSIKMSWLLIFINSLGFVENFCEPAFENF